jgi:integrase
MHRNDAFRMIKSRGQASGLPPAICNHTFRATGITVFRANGGTLEQAQQIANHASPRTTKLYDRSEDQITHNMIAKVDI